MATGQTVITGGLVLASGASQAAPADLLLRDDCIEAIAQVGSVTSESTRRIDASGRLIIPGLINAHTHGHGGLAKGSGDRWSLETLLNSGPWLNGSRNDDDRYLSTLLTAVEMLRKGCTACYDLAAMLPVPSEAGLHSIAQAYTDAGMRAVIAPMIADRSFYQAIPGLLEAFPADQRAFAETMLTAPGEATLTAMRDAARTWSYPADRIRLGIAPTIPLHCSEEFMCGCRDLAVEYGMPLQTHLAESAVQRAAALQRYGMTLTRHLDRLGVLGPRFSAAHAIWIDADEMDLIAARGGAIAHNPGSNLRLGNGIADMRPAIARGISVGVGTDGSSSADNQNMFEAMRLAAFVSRVFDRPPEDWIGAVEALRLATEGSAAVLGMAEMIGRIAPGYKADLVFLDLDNVNLVPLNNAAQQLVNGEDGTAVRDVMIGGEYVLRDFTLVGIDWPRIVVRARAAAERLKEANAEMRAKAEVLAPVISQFCVGLGRCAHDLPRKLPGVMDLQGRVGIVTGPAKGMGAAITLALAEAGADLILAGRDTAAIEPVASEISGKGRKVFVVACDVTDETDIGALMSVVGDRFAGRIDLLVNVAGGSGTLGKPFWENTRGEFEQIVTLNVTACFLTMRAVLPTMIAQRYGKVVNVGGTFGLRGRAGRAAYSTSKWALRGLTKSAALEAGPYNVNINCVCPGMVEGERFDRVRTDMGARLQISPDEARERMAAEYALRRISTAEDVANSVVFLASDRSRQITGQDLGGRRRLGHLTE